MKYILKFISNQNILKYAAAGIFGLLIICTSLFAYLTFYPLNIIDFYTPKNPIVTKQVKAGDKVQWSVDVYHHTQSIKVDVSREVYRVNGDTKTLVATTNASYVTQKGRHTFNNASLQIPNDATPGKYYVVIYNTFHLNPLRNYKVVRYTEEFEVIN